MNEKNIIKQISVLTNVPQIKVKEILKTQQMLIIEALKNGESVNLVGFGKYRVHNKNKGLRRNPKTGEFVLGNAYATPKFSFSDKVKILFK